MALAHVPSALGRRNWRGAWPAGSELMILQPIEPRPIMIAQQLRVNPTKKALCHHGNSYLSPSSLIRGDLGTFRYHLIDITLCGDSQNLFLFDRVSVEGNIFVNLFLGLRSQYEGQ